MIQEIGVLFVRARRPPALLVMQVEPIVGRQQHAGRNAAISVTERFCELAARARAEHTWVAAAAAADSNNSAQLDGKQCHRRGARVLINTSRAMRLTNIGRRARLVRSFRARIQAKRNGAIIALASGKYLALAGANN